MSERVLYFGLRCPPKANYVHCPLIKIQPLALPPQELISCASHAIFTSRTAVELLKTARQLSHLSCLAVGAATGQALRDAGVSRVCCAIPETAEGLCLLLNGLTDHRRIFYPHSVRSRPLIKEHLNLLKLNHDPWPLYDTHSVKPDPLPELADFDVLYFSSPSCVQAFLTCFGSFPEHCQLKAIGPITQAALKAAQREICSV